MEAHDAGHSEVAVKIKKQRYSVRRKILDASFKLFRERYVGAKSSWPLCDKSNSDDPAYKIRKQRKHWRDISKRGLLHDQKRSRK